MTDQPGATGVIATIPLPDHIRTYLDDERFATISTVDPDGTPFLNVLWYTIDGDEVVINSKVGRRWPTNLLRDPRIGFTVNDIADGYRWVALYGTVRTIHDWATTQADIAGMCRRYDADDPEAAERTIRDKFEREERVTFRFRPTRISDHLEGD
jgi:PPOX class probable F420-dependent enzyme